MLVERLAPRASDATRGILALALGLIGETRAILALRAVLFVAHGRPELRASTALALALLGDEELVPALAARLPEVSDAAELASLAWSLGIVGDARAVEPLLVLFERQDAAPIARARAAAALGRICDHDAHEDGASRGLP